MKQFRLTSTAKNETKIDYVVVALNEKHARYVAINPCGPTVVDPKLVEVKVLYAS